MVQSFSVNTSRHSSGLISLLKRHSVAFWYALTVIVPVILRTGRKPVIFDKFSGLGDIVCTIPAALELKKRHEGAPFIYNCYEGYAVLPRMGGVTTHVTTIRHIGLIKYWYRFLLGGFYNFASDDDTPNVNHSELYIKTYGRRHGVVVKGEHPPLTVEPLVYDKLKNTLATQSLKEHPLIVINTGPTLNVKEWPIENWTYLISKLQERGFTNIVRIGTTQVMRYGEVVVPEIPGVVSFINKLSLEESIALIAMGDLFLGPDSGLLHCAASLKTPSVGLWGATSPQFLFSAQEARTFVVSRVPCQGCHHRVPLLHWDTGCPNDIACMKAITVEEVLEQCLSCLKSEKPT